MEITDASWPDTLKGGFVQKFNPANVPNAKDIGPGMYDEYKVANWITEEGFIIDIKKFEELGIPRLTRLKDLLNPKLAGRVSFPDINVNAALNPIVGFAAEGGRGENNIDPGLACSRSWAFTRFGIQARKSPKCTRLVRSMPPSSMPGGVSVSMAPESVSAWPTRW